MQYAREWHNKVANKVAQRDGTRRWHKKVARVYLDISRNTKDTHNKVARVYTRHIEKY